MKTEKAAWPVLVKIIEEIKNQCLYQTAQIVIFFLVSRNPHAYLCSRYDSQLKSICQKQISCLELFLIAI